MILICGDGGKGEGGSVVIGSIMDSISPLVKVVDEERDMVGGGGTERTNCMGGSEGANEEEEWG